jgi:N-acetylglutamate synthase-like GNAT family acetyltransferase
MIVDNALVLMGLMMDSENVKPIYTSKGGAFASSKKVDPANQGALEASYLLAYSLDTSRTKDLRGIYKLTLVEQAFMRFGRHLLP